MCARRTGDGKVDPGRHMGDYWPAFQRTQQSSTKGELQALLQCQSASRKLPTLAERATEVRRGVLLALRAAKASVVDGVRDGRALLRAMQEQRVDAMQLQKLIRELTLNTPSLASPDERVAFALRMYKYLADLLPREMTADEFSGLGLFINSPVEEPTENVLPTVCTVMHSGHELKYTLGTVASMKGETHVASLVLESYGGASRRFDLQMALPFLAGIGKEFNKCTATQKLQMRNLYVAMSRPTQFLCLAANESRVDSQTLDALAAKRWDIDYVS
jgi:DNA helicase-2/ATP-dependent DNA helicase PcrA